MRSGLAPTLQPYPTAWAMGQRARGWRAEQKHQDQHDDCDLPSRSHPGRRNPRLISRSGTSHSPLIGARPDARPSLARTRRSSACGSATPISQAEEPATSPLGPPSISPLAASSGKSPTATTRCGTRNRVEMRGRSSRFNQATATMTPTNAANHTTNVRSRASTTIPASSQISARQPETTITVRSIARLEPTGSNSHSRLLASPPQAWLNSTGAGSYLPFSARFALYGSGHDREDERCDQSDGDRQLGEAPDQQANGRAQSTAERAPCGLAGQQLERD